MATSSLGDLISSVQPLLPTSLRQDAWYIVLIAALVASGRPEEVGPLFGHVMTSKTASAAVAGESLGDGSGERGSGEKEKERVSLRFRDVLMKTWTLTGIPPVIVAFGSLAKEEGEDKERAEGSELSEKWRNIDITPTGPIYERGTKRLEMTYMQNLSPIFSSWGSHREDLEYLEKAVIYGTYLADLSVLDSIEAQLVCGVAILCGGIRGPSIWHLRGMRRVGLSEDDVEKVREVSQQVAMWCGVDKVKVEGWPGCKDIPAGDL